MSRRRWLRRDVDSPLATLLPMSTLHASCVSACCPALHAVPGFHDQLDLPSSCRGPVLGATRVAQQWWSPAGVRCKHGLAQLQQAAPGSGREGVPGCEAPCHTDRAVGRAVTWGPLGPAKLQCRA